jgi:Spy/CpxP family protein refolding chaperone
MTDFFRRNATALVVLLLVSLAGNLFLGGVWVGRFAHHRGHGEWSDARDGGGMVEKVLERIAGDLPRDQRKAFRELMEQQRDKLAAGGQDMRTARDALRATIAAHPFERAKFDAAFAAMRERSQTFWTDLQQAIGDALEKVDAAPAP